MYDPEAIKDGGGPQTDWISPRPVSFIHDSKVFTLDPESHWLVRRWWRWRDDRIQPFFLPHTALWVSHALLRCRRVHALRGLPSSPAQPSWCSSHWYDVATRAQSMEWLAVDPVHTIGTILVACLPASICCPCLVYFQQMPGTHALNSTHITAEL
jgi:hypothetical protein